MPKIAIPKFTFNLDRAKLIGAIKELGLELGDITPGEAGSSIVTLLKPPDRAEADIAGDAALAVACDLLAPTVAALSNAGLSFSGVKEFRTAKGSRTIVVSNCGERVPMADPGADPDADPDVDKNQDAATAPPAEASPAPVEPKQAEAKADKKGK